MRQDDEKFELHLLLDMPNNNNFANESPIHVIPTNTHLKCAKISNKKKSNNPKEVSSQDVFTKILRTIKANHYTVMSEENSHHSFTPLPLGQYTHTSEDKTKNEDECLDQRKRKFTQISCIYPNKNQKLAGEEINPENKKFKTQIRLQMTQQTLANYFKKY